jgi:hypothetical protein
VDFIQIKEYLRENWMRVAVSVGAALLVISAIVMAVLWMSRSKTIAHAPGQASVAAGLPHALDFTDLYGVSIDNHVDARPSAGVAASPLVFELPVEGGITRFLAFFERGSLPEKIGPVRSARPYFLDYIQGFGPALFVHFGGSDEALHRIASTSVLKDADIDGMSDGTTFWRDESRDAPHNAYVSATNVGKVFDARSISGREVSGWLVAPDPAPADRGTMTSIMVPYSTLSYDPEWRYDHDRNVFVRAVNGATIKDEGGEAIEAKNVIVLVTQVDTIDAIGRKKVVTTGSGTATVFHDGKKTDATWRRSTNDVPPRFYDASGTEVPLTEGNIWIEVVPKGTILEVK